MNNVGTINNRGIIRYENVEIKGQAEVILVQVQSITKDEVVLGVVAERNPRLPGLPFGTPVRAMFLKEDDARLTYIGKQHKRNQRRQLAEQCAADLYAAITGNTGRSLLKASTKMSGLV